MPKTKHARLERDNLSSQEEKVGPSMLSGPNYTSIRRDSPSSQGGKVDQSVMSESIHAELKRIREEK